MLPIAAAIDEIAERTTFSGVVRVDGAGVTEFESAYGLADRRHAIGNTVDTRFAIASGAKGLTALVVMSLVNDGTLDLATTARSVLGSDLPLIDDRVTVEHLLGHRSGIGDYLDEDAGHVITDYVMPVPVQQLATTEDFVAVLSGFPMAFAPGERFAYNNGGYVVLALIAERSSGTAFHELVARRVAGPADMPDTAFFRSDEIPDRTALGYLAVDEPRTNVFHLPVRGNGDGGIYSTVADLSSFWLAFLGGTIVPPEHVAEMVRPRSTDPDEPKRYGLGFWLHATSEVVWLAGYDAGVSFRSVRDPTNDITHTVISNTSEGAWEVLTVLDDLTGTGAG